MYNEMKWNTYTSELHYYSLPDQSVYYFYVVEQVYKVK